MTSFTEGKHFGPSSSNAKETSCLFFPDKLYYTSFKISYMKKLLDSDWLRAVQLKSNMYASAKRVIPVPKASYQCKLQIKILEPTVLVYPKDTITLRLFLVYLCIIEYEGLNATSKKQTNKYYKKWNRLLYSCSQVILYSI